MHHGSICVAGLLRNQRHPILLLPHHHSSTNSTSRTARGSSHPHLTLARLRPHNADPAPAPRTPSTRGNAMLSAHDCCPGEPRAAAAAAMQHAHVRSQAKPSSTSLPAYPLEGATPYDLALRNSSVCQTWRGLGGPTLRARGREQHQREMRGGREFPGLKTGRGARGAAGNSEGGTYLTTTQPPSGMPLMGTSIEARASTSADAFI